MVADMSNHKPLMAGALFAALGAFFSINAYLTLEIGDVSAMGPGFFPLALGLILMLLGVAIALQGLRSTWSRFGPVSPRGVLCLGLAPVLFSQTAHGLGLLASVALTTAVASFGSRLMTVRVAAGVVVVTTVLCVLVFHMLIGLSIPLVGAWLKAGGA